VLAQVIKDLTLDIGMSRVQVLFLDGLYVNKFLWNIKHRPFLNNNNKKKRREKQMETKQKKKENEYKNIEFYGKSITRDFKLKFYNSTYLFK
jgi:heme exporter protein D